MRDAVTMANHTRFMMMMTGNGNDVTTTRMATALAIRMMVKNG